MRQPLDVEIIQNLDFDQYDQGVYHPVEKECNSRAELKYQLINWDRICLSKNCVYLLILYQKLKNSEKFSCITHVDYDK